jgi:hypothetical protein
MCSRYFDPVNNNHLPSINITHQTAPSFVLVYERVAYYSHKHRRGYTEPIFSIGLANGKTDRAENDPAIVHIIIRKLV